MVVLAAGMGSRFGGPKQLVPVGPAGETILDYNAHDALAAGFDQLVVVTRAELEDDVHAVINGGAALRAPIHVVLQDVPVGRIKPLGTADAAASASKLVDGPFGVANADDLYGPGAFATLARSLRTSTSGTKYSEGAVVGFPLETTVPSEGSVSRAVLRVDPAGMLTDLVEVHGVARTPAGWTPKSVPGIGPLSGSEHVSMNLWGLPHWVMDALALAVDEFDAQDSDREIYLPEVLRDLVITGRLTVRMLRTEEPWAGMTNPEDIELVRQHASQRWPSPLW